MCALIPSVLAVVVVVVVVAVVVIVENGNYELIHKLDPNLMIL